LCAPTVTVARGPVYQVDLEKQRAHDPQYGAVPNVVRPYHDSLSECCVRNPDRR